MQGAINVLKNAILPSNFKFVADLNYVENAIQKNVMQSLTNVQNIIRQLFKDINYSEKYVIDVAKRMDTNGGIDLSDGLDGNGGSKVQDLPTTSNGMIDLTGANSKYAKNLKISGKICITNVPHITVSSVAGKNTYFTQIYLPNRFVATPLHPEKMHYVVKLNNAMTVTTIDGTKIKLAKGTKLVAVRGNAHKSHTHSSSHSITLVIQKGANAGKIFITDNSKITFLQQLTDNSIQYLKETAEKFINTCNKGKPATSGNNRLFWINHFLDKSLYTKDVLFYT